MSYVNYHNRKLPGFVRYGSDLWRYRHLCWNLVGADLRARFRRSRLGILWAVIQPLAYSLIIAWAWGAIFNAPNYWAFAVYVFSGMLVWDYFGNSVNGALDGLVGASGYLKQARVPLFIFQVRIPLSGMVNLMFGLVGLILVMAAVNMLPPVGQHLLLIPASLGVIFMFMTPLAMIFSVLGAQARDLKHIMGLVLQMLFFLSPVMIERSFLDSPHLAILKIVNPMVSLLDMFRAPLLYGQMWDPVGLVTVCIWGAALWVLSFIVVGQAGRRIVFML